MWEKSCGKLVMEAHPGYGPQIFRVQFGWSSVGGRLLQGGGPWEPVERN